ncbi:hypothetical protein COU78_03460 [Candidatus Peregrinibacteria bacterium CG10_big_fil_rev_8_21_14_0_10_49_24]|nr:MAG: hypothetical protein COV83_05280 [Candidatus Peregrinibacteria bacterium CG11_big_fil_rev_8_21_14_0_20_49_14]PIR51177.1 MAG: hypothetical protein COU78_03460 [Candidatus Peregrinibacteria bacterium CG10_big_fil_rev_8_21_14_0_10_49_24]PJA67216.1 MAG: hypothetical protein CO157_05615 [Candidatus Peregrinibacteria bacterium CG_4_9_14_3_um_filter_49_12]
MTHANPPLSVSWRKPHTVVVATALFLLVFWIPYDLHSGNTPFPLQECLAYLSGTDNDSIVHFSKDYGYKVSVPREWIGRSHVYKTALQSCGFSPVARKDAPEVVIAVQSTPRNVSIESVVTPRIHKNTFAKQVRVGNTTGLWYRSTDDREMVSALYRGREYDIILSSSKADRETRDRFKKIVREFRFVEV